MPFTLCSTERWTARRGRLGKEEVSSNALESDYCRTPRCILCRKARLTKMTKAPRSRKVRDVRPRAGTNTGTAGIILLPPDTGVARMALLLVYPMPLTLWSIQSSTVTANPPDRVSWCISHRAHHSSCDVGETAGPSP